MGVPLGDFIGLEIRCGGAKAIPQARYCRRDFGRSEASRRLSTLRKAWGYSRHLPSKSVGSKSLSVISSPVLARKGLEGAENRGKGGGITIGEILNPIFTLLVARRKHVSINWRLGPFDFLLPLSQGGNYWGGQKYIK